MARSVLAEASPAPDLDAFAVAVGRARPLWRDLIRWLTEDVGAQVAMQWGGPSYGWELRFIRAGKPLTTLTPLKDGFVALVILGRAQAEEAGSLRLSERGRRIFEGTPQQRDGRWMFLDVEDERDVSDIEALLCLKLPRRLRARLTSSQG